MLDRDRDVIDRTGLFKERASKMTGTERVAILTVGMLINDGLYKVAEAIERIGDVETAVENVETAVENVETAVETIGNLETPLMKMADGIHLLSDIGPAIKHLADSK